MENNLRDKQIKKVSIIGIIFNIFLLIIKAIIGVISNSQAMIADSLNSSGDIFASLMSYIGAKFSAKPKDEDHPYGHGKAEYVFSFIISISMIIASIAMIRNSIYSIINNQVVKFSIWLIIVCIITILTKFCLYIYSNGKYKQNNSILIKSSKEDHRNDIFVTIGTIVGIVCSYFGYSFMDGLFGCIISLWICYVGIRLLNESYRVLMDTGLKSSILKEIIKDIENYEDIMHVDSITSKPVGNRYILIVKLSMDGDISLEKAHNISGKIKEDIVNKYDFLTDIIIHLNPHTI